MELWLQGAFRHGDREANGRFGGHMACNRQESMATQLGSLLHAPLGAGVAGCDGPLSAVAAGSCLGNPATTDIDGALYHDSRLCGHPERRHPLCAFQLCRFGTLDVFHQRSELLWPQCIQQCKRDQENRFAQGGFPPGGGDHRAL